MTGEQGAGDAGTGHAAVAGRSAPSVAPAAVLALHFAEVTGNALPTFARQFDAAVRCRVQTQDRKLRTRIVPAHFRFLDQPAADYFEAFFRGRRQDDGLF